MEAENDRRMGEKMRKVYSKDTNEELPMDGNSDFRADVQVDADGEGGVFLSMCWHEMRTLGSVAVRIFPEQVPVLIKAIQDVSKNVDKCPKDVDTEQPSKGQGWE